MQYNIEILRCEDSDSEQYTQTLVYESDDMTETVSHMLNVINASDEIRNVSGNVITPIAYEHSCLQKRCGACAMVINNRPSLACDATLNDVQLNGHIRLEPLRKFPVIRDLIVDRSIMMDNLKQLGLWAKETNITLDDKRSDISYESSRCLQCGCCLEVCPNFVTGEDFYGAAGFVPTTRLLSEMSKADREKLAHSYKMHIYKTCAKSLACHDICPAGIDVEKVLSASNAVAVWNRGGRK